MTEFEVLTSFANLHEAYRRASRGKRGKPAVAEFEHRLEEELLGLKEELDSGTYRPGPYECFHVHEPKRRLISAAPFRDRVVHHALCQVIGPRFERSFVEESFANQVGKGTHRAIDHAQRMARRFRYVLACDVRQFFPSIDHEILLGILRRKVIDAGVLRLVRQILGSGASLLGGEYSMVYFTGDDLFARSRPRGLPIGNLTSQFWANCYLNPFDHFVKRELRMEGYVRYVDDFLLFSDDKADLWRAKHGVECWLARLRLTLHERAQPHRTHEGIGFLGFTLRPDHRRLKRRKAIHAERRLREGVRQVVAGEIPLAALTCMVRGWVNHARYGNTVGLRKAVLGRLRFVLPLRRTRSSQVQGSATG